MHTEDLSEQRTRLRDLLGVDIPADPRPVWTVVIRLGDALLAELEYQDGRLSAALRQQGEALAATRSLLRDYQERERLQAARSLLLGRLRSEGQARERLETARSLLLGQLWLRQVEQMSLPERAAAGVLPTLPSYAERLAWLSGQAPELRSAKQVEMDLPSRLVKVPHAAQVATQYGVPPRWLAFGEQAPGHDSAGLPTRLVLSRQVRNWGQRDLRHQTGVSAGMISMLETGRNPRGGALTASLYVVGRLAAGLEVSPGWLAYGGPLLPNSPSPRCNPRDLDRPSPEKS